MIRYSFYRTVWSLTSLALLSCAAAQSVSAGTRAIDLTVDTRKCRAGELWDSVTERCLKFTKLTITNGAFYNKQPVGPLGSFAPLAPLTADALASGLTIAVSTKKEHLNPQQNYAIITIADAYENPLFTLIRGKGGAIYIGKETSTNSKMSYIAKIWDPVSACATITCSSETIYLSFFPNGMIRIDSFSIFDRPVGKQYASWQTGLLNAGFPVLTYRSGGPIDKPTQLPDFVLPGGIGLPALPKDFYGALSRYKNPTAPFNNIPQTRVALWINGILGTDVIGLQKAIVEEQSRLLPPGVARPNWLPCNNGIFQRNAPGDGSPSPTTQYSPRDLPTPCNPDVSATWDYPAGRLSNGPHIPPVEDLEP